MNTVGIIFLVIVALVLSIALVGLHLATRGGKFESEIRKHLEEEFKLKTDQAFEIINSTRDEHTRKAQETIDKIQLKIVDGDEYLKKAREKLDEATKLRDEAEENRKTSIETIEKTQKNYQESRDYLQTAKDKDKAAQHHLDETKTLHLEAEALTQKLFRAEGNIFDSMCQFIRNHYSSEQTQTKLKVFAKGFAHYLESLAPKV